MVNKCVLYGCKSGYDSGESAASFRFPFKNDGLLAKWIQFVNRADWKPSTNSVICSKHFDKKLICNGQKKIKLDSKPYSHNTYCKRFKTTFDLKKSFRATKTP